MLLLSVYFACETQELVYAVKIDIFYTFMWNWRQSWDEVPDLPGCLFSYAVFGMVVNGQCCAVKFHFLKLSIQLFCFFFSVPWIV